jgi:hypothetical protein
MSDSHDDSEQTEESEGIKNLRAKAAKADDAEARAAQAERKLAFVEAGIPLSSKPAQAFLNSYSGEMTPEAIKAEATEWGLIQADDAPPPPKFDDETPERKFQQQRDQLDAGGVPDPDASSHKGGVDAALEGFAKAREAGVSPADAVNDAFGAVIKAAAMGDSQAVFDTAKWQQEQAKRGHGAEFAR